MIDSKGSVIVGDKGAFAGLAGAVVVPDRGGQREDALQDADEHASRGVPAVSFQVELTFEGLVDRLDGLAQGLEQARAGSVGLALAGRAQQPDPGLVQGGLVLTAVVVLVPDENLAGPVGDQGRVVAEDAQQRLVRMSRTRPAQPRSRLL